MGAPCRRPCSSAAACPKRCAPTMPGCARRAAPSRRCRWRSACTSACCGACSDPEPPQDLPTRLGAASALMFAASSAGPMPAHSSAGDWRRKLAPALEATFDELANEADWVLGDTGGEVRRLQKDRAWRDEIATQVGKRHAQRVIAAWSRQLDALALAPGTDADGALAPGNANSRRPIRRCAASLHAWPTSSARPRRAAARPRPLSMARCGHASAPSATTRQAPDRKRSTAFTPWPPASATRPPMPSSTRPCAPRPPARRPRCARSTSTSAP